VEEAGRKRRPENPSLSNEIQLFFLKTIKSGKFKEVELKE